MPSSNVRLAWVLGLVAGMGLVGCQPSESPAPEGGGDAVSTSTEQPKEAGPDAVVRDFLDAIRDGNDQTAASLLTPLARKATEEMGMVVAPERSDTATFDVGEFEIEGDGSAQVASTWTDLDETGQPHSDTIVWLLKQQPDGWRIMGMGTKVFEDMDPLYLNFEDPADMQRKQQAFEAELARRAGISDGGAADGGIQEPLPGQNPPADQPAGTTATRPSGRGPAR
jgi:hypothetical protein